VGAAAPLLLGAAPALARPSGGTPLALVTADLESSIVAIRLSTGSVHKSIETPADPRSIESIGGRDALVAHTGSGRMTRICGRTTKTKIPLRSAVTALLATCTWKTLQRAITWI